MSDLVTAPSSRQQPYEDLRVMIGRMDGKLDIVLATSADHGRRLADLEAWKNRAIGWVLAAAFAGGVTADQIINLIVPK